MNTASLPIVSIRAALTLLAICGPLSTITTAQLPLVPPVDFSKLDPADFTDEELDMPYYLAHLHRVANSVVPEGPERGFIDIVVWRKARDNRPYNARIMENHLALAYFYCLDRPWNVYRGHPALRARLEAVLEYWWKMQNDDGQFSEYGPREWNLPATAFATKFMGQTLTLLSTGPPIDSTLLRHVVEADRKAIFVVLTDDALYEHGRKYSNQYTNVWSGALAYLRLYPDEEIEQLLRTKIVESIPEFQSPAGYFYEKNGPDWSYNLRTHQTNLAAARHFTDDAELMSIWDKKDRHFYDWLSYNAVLEPDQSGFYMNRAIETRQRVAYLGREPRGLFSRVTPPGKRVEAAVPFSVAHEEREERRRQGRADLNANWPAVASLKAFEPYHFLSRDFDLGLPSLSHRERATAKLPYLARERFTHQRVDSRIAASFTYIRRPTYYAAFNAGEISSGVSQTRLGLGLLWSPAIGSLLQSQTGSHDAAWGTMAASREQVYEADSLAVTFAVGNRTLRPSPGVRDVPDEAFEATYALGMHGTKTVRFEEDAICVHVQHPGEFTEILPLLCSEEDSVTVGDKGIELKTPCGALKVLFSGKVTAQLEKAQRSDWLKSVRVVQLHAQDELTYELRLASRLPADEG